MTRAVSKLIIFGNCILVLLLGIANIFLIVNFWQNLSIWEIIFNCLNVAAYLLVAWIIIFLLSKNLKIHLLYYVNGLIFVFGIMFIVSACLTKTYGVLVYSICYACFNIFVTITNYFGFIKNHRRIV
jgi:hypothetical protein